ncbi:DHA2 family efflux MFS transporter permease subunit [Thermomonospora umbrina]|uniref:EmrB/QacA subfamily drug resistance transporter n=1 Tax=Thermomonospora umbrina TaxID=111806 RepID=A0A3D9SGZ0_9ACTN|nr:DHA2 family efflux MFS transporter permease subunit [Thermomonospora umbrina]REE95166.1 EmrB/QacA subfamily drug resistance transporter [Thermomonospora umbrina]
MADTTAAPASPASTRRRGVPVLAAGATFLAMLDSTVTNLAVPDLRGDFPDASVAALSWVITIYFVAFAALLAPSGRLADLIGRRSLFLLGVGAFTAMSLACALAPNLPTLLVARGLQGAAAAAMIPASLALLLRDTAPERRGGAIGLWSAAGAAAAAVGPSLGGVLVDAFNWRALFLINVPVGLLMLAGAARLPRTAATAAAGARVPDLVGTVLLGGGVGAIALGVTQTQEWAWGDTRTIGVLAAGAAMVAAALWRSARHPVPALEISLWRSRTFAVANLASALYGAALYPWLLVGTLVLIEMWDYSPTKAGLAMTPGAFTATAAAIVMGRLTGRFGVRPAVTGGMLIIVFAGVWTMTRLSEEPAFLTLWLPMGLLAGAGMGMVTTGTSSAAALSVSPLRFAGATGLNTTARQLGGALGLAAFAALMPAAAALDDYLAVYAFCTTAALAAALTGLWLTVRAPHAPAQNSPKEEVAA